MCVPQDAKRTEEASADCDKRIKLIDGQIREVDSKLGEKGLPLLDKATLWEQKSKLQEAKSKLQEDMLRAEKAKGKGKSLLRDGVPPLGERSLDSTTESSTSRKQHPAATSVIEQKFGVLSNLELREVPSVLWQLHDQNAEQTLKGLTWSREDQIANYMLLLLKDTLRAASLPGIDVFPNVEILGNKPDHWLARDENSKHCSRVDGAHSLCSQRLRSGSWK